MNDLLASALEAAGGLDRWDRTTTIDMDASINGELFDRRGQSGSLSDVRISFDTHRQQLAFRGFGTRAETTTFEPHQTQRRSSDGTVLESRSDPRAHFVGHSMQDPWDDLDLTYALGYGIYTMLVAPFSLAMPGVVTHEIEPIEEAGEHWRRLDVTFPPESVTHDPNQTCAFDSRGLLRRIDFTPSVGSVPPSAVYAAEYRTAEGFTFPTRRVNVPVDPDGRSNEEKRYMLIETSNTEIHWS
jgi:hypothetical protein